jgi:hypothetical protein
MRAIAVSFIFLFLASTVWATPKQCNANLRGVNSALKGKLDFDIENLWSTFDNEIENSIDEITTADVPNGLNRKNPIDGSSLPLETFVMTITFKNGKKMYLREIEKQTDRKGAYTTDPSWKSDYTMAQVDKNFATRLNNKSFNFKIEAGAHSTTILRGEIGSNKFLGIGGHPLLGFFALSTP